MFKLQRWNLHAHLSRTAARLSSVLSSLSNVIGFPVKSVVIHYFNTPLRRGIAFHLYLESVDSKVFLFLLIQSYQCPLLQELHFHWVKFREEYLAPSTFLSHEHAGNYSWKLTWKMKGHGLWQLPFFISPGVESINFHFMLWIACNKGF